MKLHISFLRISIFGFILKIYIILSSPDKIRPLYWFALPAAHLTILGRSLTHSGWSSTESKSKKAPAEQASMQDGLTLRLSQQFVAFMGKEAWSEQQISISLATLFQIYIHIHLQLAWFSTQQAALSFPESSQRGKNIHPHRPAACFLSSESWL